MITSFRGNYFFLSNFYPCSISYDSFTFSCVEAAFQAAKCANREDMSQFQTLGAAEAKKLGRRISLRQDWDSVKVEIMRDLLHLKFSSIELAQMLLSTGSEILQEGNTWNDTFWGVNAHTGQGRNVLGKLLMEVRAELAAR